MKSEPEVYSIHDLEKDQAAMWEGCRNYQVRNFMRDQMKIGDQAFFYHSNANPSGISGIMQIVSEAYPDPTQFQEDSEYYDNKSSLDHPKWLVVDVKHVSTFQQILSLKYLKSIDNLKDMQVNRKGQRLSITPVTTDEWNTILKLSSHITNN